MLDVGAMVIAARQRGLLVNGGGHPMAAGLTVQRARLADLVGFFTEETIAAIGAQPPARTLAVDTAVQARAVSVDLVRLLERVGPFGVGNPEPRIVLPHVRAGWSRPVGEAHVRCTLVGSDGGAVQAIAFRAAGSPLGAALMDPTSPTLHVAGTLRIDRFNGSEAVSLHVQDAALVRPGTAC
jgi:single-stranded-DNA-specific exonuclease